MKRFFCYLFLALIVAPISGLFYQTTDSFNSKTYSESISVYGGTPLDIIYEKVDYSYKTIDSYFNPYELPKYLSSYTCGISAGGEVIGHYDRIYEELIPNHQGRLFLGKYLYAPQDTEVEKMYNSLFALMNATNEGVTISGYKNGLTSYVKNRGKTAAFTPIFNGNTLNATQYKQSMKSGKLLSIFVDGFNIVQEFDIEEFDGYDYITIYRNIGAHVMIAYGYYDISYFNSDNQCFRKDCYLYVATGFSTPALALVRINQHCTIDDGYITEIY